MLAPQIQLLINKLGVWELTRLRKNLLLPANLGTISCPQNGPLAQLVEHRTFNPMVVGSNPTRPTIFPVKTLA